MQLLFVIVLCGGTGSGAIQGQKTHTWMCACFQWPAQSSKFRLSTPEGRTGSFHRLASEPFGQQRRKARTRQRPYTIVRRAFCPGAYSVASPPLHSAEESPGHYQWAIRRTTTRHQNDRQEFPDSRPHAGLGHQSDRQELPGDRPDVGDDIRASAKRLLTGAMIGWRMPSLLNSSAIPAFNWYLFISLDLRLIMDYGIMRCEISLY